MIAADSTELRRSHAIRELVVRTLGSVFQGLAVVPAVLGITRVAELLAGREPSVLIALLGARWRGVVELPDAKSSLLLPVSLPVAAGLFAAWFCFALGRSLKRHSPTARWTAVLILTAASVPPVKLFFLAFWGRAFAMALAAFALAAVAAGFALALSARTTDAVFAPEYRLLVRAAPVCDEALSVPLKLGWKFGLMGLGALLVAVLVALTQ